MRKLILIIAALTAGNLAFSQLIPGFSIGPKVGASFSSLSTDIDELETEMKNTIHFC